MGLKIVVIVEEIERAIKTYIREYHCLVVQDLVLEAEGDIGCSGCCELHGLKDFRSSPYQEVPNPTATSTNSVKLAAAKICKITASASEGIGATQG